MAQGMTRRGAILTVGALSLAGAANAEGQNRVERWGLYEIALPATAVGNPFDVKLVGVFTNGRTTLRAPGFYDGEGVWRIRFSPPETGAWRWTSESSLSALDGRQGRFEAMAPGAGNHGPVGVVETYHFAMRTGRPIARSAPRPMAGPISRRRNGRRRWRR